MFCFVIGPVLHFLAASIGSFFRQLLRIDHTEAEDDHGYSHFFVQWSLVITFAFASGSHFVALFSPTIAAEEPVEPALGTLHLAGTFNPKAWARGTWLSVSKEKSEHHGKLDPRVSSGLHMMIGKLRSS